MGSGNDRHLPETTRRTLLLLLRQGLWGLAERQDARLSPQEWKDVYRLAGEHTVTGLAFDGLSLLPADALPPQPLLMQWTAETDAIERRNRKMDRVTEQLYKAFHANGIEPVLQKGQGVARYYNNPTTRVCGDIDLYFPDTHAWTKAMALLKERGITPTRQADKSAVFAVEGITVECHRQLLDLYNPFLQGYARKLERRNGYRHIALTPGAEANITVPAPLPDLLLQYLHIQKHAISRGIGLRQLCDMARACYRLHGETDPEETRRVCKRLGMERWCPLLHTFLTTELGLPADCLPYHETASEDTPLADIVWHGGNFGQHAQTRRPETTAWRRKWNTIRAFQANMRFAGRYAPKETFWYFTQLLKGQF